MHQRFSRQAHRSLRRRHELKKTLRAYLFLSPFLIFFAAFLFLPVAFLFWLTFHAEGILAPPTFVGLANWRRTFADPLVLKTIANTLLYCLMAIPAVFVLAMVLALALRSIQRGRTLIRTLIYLPTLQPSLVVALIWTFVLHPDFGILNVVARAAIGRPINFLGEPSNALATIAMVEVWRGLGFWSVLFLSGLMALPIELYYAAELEGAGPVRRFFALTLPLLKPIFYFSVIFATIVNLQLFDSVFALTDGGPAHATATVTWYVYRSLFDFADIGFGSTLSFVLVLVVLVLTAAQTYLLREKS
ncbi:MAG: sugar ABC transporter permease [Methylobacteriaceae bacterium]|nr:sugar ABC transporter permease [Methylobacteriaceae bacterium]